MSIISSILNGAKSQEAAEEYRKAAQGMPLVGRAKEIYGCKTSQATHLMSEKVCLDNELADNACLKSRYGWYDHWALINDGRFMPSFKDCCSAFITLKRMYFEGNHQQRDEVKKYLDSFQQEWCTGGIYNTIISYRKDELYAELRHYRNTYSRSSNRPSFPEVPVYEGGYLLENVCNYTKGLKFMNILTGIYDKEELVSLFEFVSGKNRDEITVWTPNMRQRKNNPEMIVNADFFQTFRIMCRSESDDILGASRGCRIQGGA